MAIITCSNGDRCANPSKKATELRRVGDICSYCRDKRRSFLSLSSIPLFRSTADFTRRSAEEVRRAKEQEGVAVLSLQLEDSEPESSAVSDPSTSQREIASALEEVEDEQLGESEEVWSIISKQ